jgi:hypothetical protein
MCADQHPSRSGTVDEHCGYTPANCPWGDACADCIVRDNPEAREAWQRNNGPVYEPITREHDA